MRKLLKIASIVAFGYALGRFGLENTAGAGWAWLTKEAPAAFEPLRVCTGCQAADLDPDSPICGDCGGQEFRQTIGRYFRRGVWPVKWNTRWEERPNSGPIATKF